MRADFARIAIIQVIGGVYVDADERCIQSLDGIEEGKDAVLYWVPSPNGEIRIRNGFIMATPQHLLFQKVMDVIVSNIRAENSNNVWEVTGPGALKVAWDQSPKAVIESVRLLTREQMFKYLKINFDMEYRRQEGHWTEQMAKTKIIEFGA